MKNRAIECLGIMACGLALSSCGETTTLDEKARRVRMQGLAAAGHALGSFQKQPLDDLREGESQ